MKIKTGASFDPKMKINLIADRLKLGGKSKKETAPKTPEEEVKYFIAEFNLDSLLPQEFNELNNGQKLKVIQDLKHRIVGIVKSDAQTQYSEHTKNGVKKLLGSVFKESKIGNWEKDIFEKLKNSPKGLDLIHRDLRILTQKAQTRDIYVSPTGKACVNYLSKETIEKTINETGVEAFSVFSEKANTFASMPYEWGQEKSGKNKNRYEKAKIEYEQARNEILKIKTAKEKPEEKGKAMLEILETDNIVKMEQLLNTHPEFEKALEDMAKDPNEIKNFGKFSATLVNLITGNNWTNRALMAGGFGARMAAKGVAAFTGIGYLAYLGGATVGGVVGGIRGRIRGKETLQERQKDARHGKKDVSKEKAVTTDATHLNDRLEKLIQEIENATTDEERTKKLSILATRIEHTQGKIEKGQVNFGDVKSSLVNQFNLTNSLNRALIIKEINTENSNKEIKERIDRLLVVHGKNIAEKTSEAQGKFIKKQMWKGAALGAGLSTLGYVAHYAGEHFGWWGGHGAENLGLKQTETPIPEPEPGLYGAHQADPGMQSAHQPGVPIAPSIVSEFTNEGITFKNGKGGIQGFLDLKEQIREQYHGDYSKAPKSVQDLMSSDHNAVEEAKKFGFYKPNGEESGLIREGSTLKFDDKGTLIFHDAKTGRDFTHYEGKMFDSDGSAKVTTPKASPEVSIPQGATTPETGDQQIGFTPAEEQIDFTPTTESDIEEQRATIESTQKPTAEELAKTIKDQIDTKEPTGTVHMGSVHQTGSEIPTGSEAIIGSEAQVGDNNYFRNLYPLDQFRDISHEDNLILERHPEFAENPYHLSGEELIEVYETSNKDLGHVFKDAPSNWIDHLPRISEMSANKVLEYQEQPSASMTANTLSGYLNILKNHAGLEPKSGFLGIGAESSKHYIARCLQGLAAGKGRDGLTLEIFEKNLRQ